MTVFPLNFRILAGHNLTGPIPDLSALKKLTVL